MSSSRTACSDSQSNMSRNTRHVARVWGNIASDMVNETFPTRRRRYSSAFEAEFDDNAPRFNRRRLDLAQTDEQPPQRNSGTQRHTDGPLQANENEPILARGSVEEDEERNDDAGSLGIPSRPQREPIVSPPRELRELIPGQPFDEDVFIMFTAVHRVERNRMIFEEPDVQFTTGLSDEELRNISTMCITKSEVESQDRCTICCTNYNEGDVVNILPCNHLYHREFVTTWLKSNGTCPNCRKSLNTNN